MAEVHGFPGVRYAVQQPEEAGALVAPPYDVISPGEQQELHDRDPRNIIHLELPRDEPGDGADRNRYTRASRQYREWLETPVLRPGPQPTLYVYGQRYSVPPSTLKAPASATHPHTHTPTQPANQRLGLLGALKVEP